MFYLITFNVINCTFLCKKTSKVYNYFDQIYKSNYCCNLRSFLISNDCNIKNLSTITGKEYFPAFL